jgi:hypothetical protein
MANMSSINTDAKIRTFNLFSQLAIQSFKKRLPIFHSTTGQEGYSFRWKPLNKEHISPADDGANRRRTVQIRLSHMETIHETSPETKAHSSGI